MKITKLTPIIRRLTAGNSNMFTGPGTNTYLLGENEVTVIDPGPPMVSHIEDLIAITGKSLKQILITHTHPDHSPGASILKKMTGVPVFGLSTESSRKMDEEIEIDKMLNHGDEIKTSEYSIEVIHTPGHASNHLCYFLIDENTLFTGDHIMEGSTVVIAPPDGNMSKYLESLELLKEYPIKTIAPGHGDLIQDPMSIVDATIEHRLNREKKVIKKLEKLGSASIDELVNDVYDDVASFLHPIAKWSLEAHLIKLMENKVVSKNKQDYVLIE